MAPVLTVHVPISQFKTIHNKACDSTLLTFFIHTITRGTHYVFNHCCYKSAIFNLNFVYFNRFGVSNVTRT